MRISDWSSDVCSSDLGGQAEAEHLDERAVAAGEGAEHADHGERRRGDHPGRRADAGQHAALGVAGTVVQLGSASARQRVSLYDTTVMFDVSLTKTCPPSKAQLKTHLTKLTPKR